MIGVSFGHLNRSSFSTVVGRAGCATGGRVVRAVGGLMRGRDVRAGERARGGLRALRAGCERFFSARARWMSSRMTIV